VTKAMRAFMLVGVLLVSAVVAPADDHLVPRDQIAEHLREAAGPAPSLGALPPSPSQTLSAEERSDLARRAANLETDPAATGAGHFVGGMLVGAALAVGVIFYMVVSDPNY
jgi:hypothetical protein